MDEKESRRIIMERNSELSRPMMDRISWIRLKGFDRAERKVG